MTTIHASTALLAQGFERNVRIHFSAEGIGRVETGVAPAAGDERHDVVVPAMPNVHSHAFQRAMAGYAEIRGPGPDTFWSWRKAMYNCALSMTPDDVEAVASQLYMEMLEAGFGRVGEFHYLHHDLNGTSYANPAEMAERIAAAADRTGIQLTLLPSFYAHSNFGGEAPIEGQRRFICDVDGFGRLVEMARKATAGVPGATVGIAPHSLRAVTGDELGAVLEFAGDGPIHIHVAEQVKEVADSLAHGGQRPVEWLLANAPVDGRWCLIHATHVTDHERAQVISRGATVGLCPVTEANLGDGIFAGWQFFQSGGRFGIGTDSNIAISLAAELRALEYAQRLARRERNVMAFPGHSTGQTLFERALAGGAKSLGVSSAIAPGLSADMISFDCSQVPWLAGAACLDHFIFANGPRIDCVWTQGSKRVENGRHIHRDCIAKGFQDVMMRLYA